MTRLVALAAAIVLASCSSSPSVTATRPAPVLTTTTAPPPTATAPAPANALPAVTTTLPAECGHPAGAVTGDFDGDGATDTAYVVDFVLVACLADGTSSMLDVGGMGEVLVAVDLQGDGLDEILAGGTTAWGQGADVAVVADGELAAVTIGGERLALWRGIPPGRVLDFGCVDEDGDGRRDVIVVEGEVGVGEIGAVRRVIAINGAAATERSRTTRTVLLAGTLDLLAEPGIRELVGPPC